MGYGSILVYVTKYAFFLDCFAAPVFTVKIQIILRCKPAGALRTEEKVAAMHRLVQVEFGLCSFVGFVGFPF